jgi:hypothetical protein
MNLSQTANCRSHFRSPIAAEQREFSKTISSNGKGAGVWNLSNDRRDDVSRFHVFSGLANSSRWLGVGRPIFEDEREQLLKNVPHSSGCRGFAVISGRT